MYIVQTSFKFAKLHLEKVQTVSWLLLFTDSEVVKKKTSTLPQLKELALTKHGLSNS